MAEHTPGPWIIGENRAIWSENFLKPAIGTTKREYAIVVFPIQDDETEANARLIVAAPDLLAACKRLVKELSDDFTGVSIAAEREAQVAIAKAEDQSHVQKG